MFDMVQQWIMNKQLTIKKVQLTMNDEQWIMRSMINEEWTMSNETGSMINEKWTMNNDQCIINNEQ